MVEELVEQVQCILTLVDRLRVGEVPRGEKMLYSGTDPESYITEYTLVYEDQRQMEPLVWD